MAHEVMAYGRGGHHLLATSIPMTYLLYCSQQFLPWLHTPVQDLGGRYAFNRTGWENRGEKCFLWTVLEICWSALISLGNEKSGRATESDLCLAASVENPFYRHSTESCLPQCHQLLATRVGKVHNMFFPSLFKRHGGCCLQLNGCESVLANIAALQCILLFFSSDFPTLLWQLKGSILH